MPLVLARDELENTLVFHEPWNRGWVPARAGGPAHRASAGQVVIDGHGLSEHGPAVVLYPLLVSTTDHQPLIVNRVVDPRLLWFIVASITNGINN